MSNAAQSGSLPGWLLPLLIAKTGVWWLLQHGFLASTVLQLVPLQLPCTTETTCAFFKSRIAATKQSPAQEGLLCACCCVCCSAVCGCHMDCNCANVVSCHRNVMLYIICVAQIVLNMTQHDLSACMDCKPDHHGCFGQSLGQLQFLRLAHGLWAATVTFKCSPRSLVTLLATCPARAKLQPLGLAALQTSAPMTLAWTAPY